MDPILQQIYSTIIPSAPFLIAAYALIWVALLVYVVVMQKGLKASEKRLALLEEAIEAKPTEASRAKNN